MSARGILRVGAGALLGIALLMPSFALAQSEEGTGLLPACTRDGNCQLVDFLQGFVNIANWGLAALGLIGVAMFITGGMYLLLSAGRSGMVATGKSILAGATTGILIVLFAWVGIGTVYVAVTGDPEGTIFEGVDGINPFSFLRSSPDGDGAPNPNRISCSPTVAPGIIPGCSELDVNGPIHRLSKILNSKPSCNVQAVKAVHDADLQAAVRRFQANNDLPVTGAVDPATWDAVWKSETHCAPYEEDSGSAGTVQTVREGCCIQNQPQNGSCAIGVKDPVTQAGSGYCGDGFTYSTEACNDNTVTANRTACAEPLLSHQWGTCAYTFSGPDGPSSRTWITGTVACDAVNGTLTPLP